MAAAANPRVAWLALPGVGFLVAAFALPLAALLITSFHGADGWTLAGYTRFFGDAFKAGDVTFHFSFLLNDFLELDFLLRWQC